VVEVGEEFLGWLSHELRVEARLGGEVGVIHRRSSGEGSIGTLGARSTTTGSRAGGGHALLTPIS
jgi:hypothetical protein